jgi:hypothetical protein
MIRSLKTLGLALVAVLALSAMAASAASAQQGKLTSDGPVTLIAAETGAAGANALTAFGNRVECPGSSYTGHKYNVTPHALIPSGETTITVTPHYKQTAGNCKAVTALGTFRATVDVNGCDYVMHLGATTGGVAHTYGVTTDVVCPVGKEIEITVFTNEADHTANKPFCVQKVPAQTGKPGIHATDTTNGHVDLAGTVTGLTVNQPASASHPFLCSAKHTLTGEFHLDVTGRGVNSLGGATNVSISE